MQTGAREELSEHGGHAADAELNGRPVADVRQEQVCDRGVLRARRVLGRIGKRRVRTLNDHVHVRDVDDFVKAAAQPRQMLVDLQNDDVRRFNPSIGTKTTHGNANIRLSQYRRIIHAVPNKYQSALAVCQFRLQCLHMCNLIRRHQLCIISIQSQLLGNISTRFCIVPG